MVERTEKYSKILTATFALIVWIYWSSSKSWCKNVGAFWNAIWSFCSTLLHRPRRVIAREMVGIKTLSLLIISAHPIRRDRKCRVSILFNPIARECLLFLLALKIHFDALRDLGPNSSNYSSAFICSGNTRKQILSVTGTEDCRNSYPCAFKGKWCKLLLETPSPGINEACHVIGL